LGEGATAVFTRLPEGLAGKLMAGLGCSSALRFRAGLGAGAWCKLFSVDACSLPRTGDSKCLLAGAGVDVGDPADEDGISSTTGGP